jgi:hypothetical protein
MFNVSCRLDHKPLFGSLGTFVITKNSHPTTLFLNLKNIFIDFDALNQMLNFTSIA